MFIVLEDPEGAHSVKGVPSLNRSRSINIALLRSDDSLC